MRQPLAASGPPPSTSAKLGDIAGWRLLGAAVWHITFAAAATTTWVVFVPPSAYPLRSVASLLTPSAIGVSVLLQLLQLVVLYCQRLLLASCPPPPLYLPKLRLHGRTWPSLVITRFFMRSGNGNTGRTAALSPLALLAATSISATATLYCFSMLRPQGSAGLPLVWCIRLGVTAGSLYSANHLLRGREVLAHPTVHRHRFHRLKGGLPAALWTALHVALAALVLCAAVTPRLGGSVPNVPALVASLGGSVLCVLGWAVGSVLLQAVFTERVRLADRGDTDINAPLLTALGSSDPLTQDLALQDLAAFSEERGGTAPHQRRAAIFADPTGHAAWSPIAGLLMGELLDLVSGLAAALPAVAGDANKAARSPSERDGAQWNVMRLSAATGTRAVSKEQDVAAWMVRARYFRASCCMRALSGLGSASMLRSGGIGTGDPSSQGGTPEDRYGVVLLASPTLGGMVTALISSLLVLQQYGRLTTSLAQRGHSGLLGRAVAHPVATTLRALGLSRGRNRLGQHPLASEQQTAAALEDLCRVCLYRLVAAFGGRLRDAVAQAGVRPWYGAPSEHAAVLVALLRYDD